MSDLSWTCDKCRNVNPRFRIDCSDCRRVLVPANPTESQTTDATPPAPHAFPSPEGGFEGMDLRDYFAGQALPACLGPDDPINGCDPDAAAERAYIIADAMIKARDK